MQNHFSWLFFMEMGLDQNGSTALCLWKKVQTATWIYAIWDQASQKKKEKLNKMPLWCALKDY